ncbi:MAG: hypothetical protein V2I34_06615 [Bacteroidales bacterium]|nr:hypothetical protein [Bacteroidales bacterium]
MSNKVFLHKQEYRQQDLTINGKPVTIDGQEYYSIENYHLMDPFLMSIVSNSDHWMYISSTGGLSAGRRNPDNAIFPYYTDDKIHESYLTTGSKTLILAGTDDKKCLWEPFSDKYRGLYRIRRNIYKNIPGNRVIFEEINEDLELIYRYAWMNSEKYGWIKKTTLVNHSGQSRQLSVLDGLRNILPYGVDQRMQNEMSTLVDAYKKSELDLKTRLGIFRLASIPVDRAIPSEALKCTSAWYTGYEPVSVCLDHKQLQKFEKGQAIETGKELKGVRGSYFTLGEIELEPGKHVHSYFVVELEQDSADIENLVYLLENNNDLPAELEKDVSLGTDKLIELVAKADGIQHSADRMSSIRHFSNVLFNAMRGGLFEDAYLVNREYYRRHLRRFNRLLFPKYEKWLDDLPVTMDLEELIHRVKKFGDTDLLRLTYEYLPLSFSRRHGDPSRPWNHFDIRLKEEDGSPSLSYQGNWRDIFQNWEALALSYPLFLPSMISRFLNSSTIDGYNPYRISSDGIDWELLDPDDPWAHIGYWGDHQVIYLLRLLELQHEFNPGQLDEWFDLEIFSYANVPYRIKDYNEILDDPYETIDFDDERNRELEEQYTLMGADAKMLVDTDRSIIKASLTEKILVSLLAKVVNFIPGAGMWMNTQRPEWNDANNALVGNGASMVTLYYMRRMLNFLAEIYSGTGDASFKIRSEIAELFGSAYNILQENRSKMAGKPGDNLRRKIMDKLGMAGSNYRKKAYSGLSGELTGISAQRLMGFFDILSEYIDLSIRENKRPDGLYNAYNLVNISGSSLEIVPLQEMLEGQVAILGSGILKPAEAVQLIENMFDSDLYRADQDSFMLYPNKELKAFRENNILQREDVEASALLQKMTALGDNSIIREDTRGTYHFNGTLRSSEDLNRTLDNVAKRHDSLVEKERKLLNRLYEKVFQHKKFTGRSGSFYKYEGLGSIYWHMVSKFLLATGEYIPEASGENCDKEVIDKLIALYYRIRAGIGMDKSPSDYGAFPFDPYSHTPSMTGVQQPGMTGQVKEDIISRYIELGITIENGSLGFKPLLLRRKEFIKDKQGLESLEFTLCGTPVRYVIAEKPSVKIVYEHGDEESSEGLFLRREQSRAVFSRQAGIDRIDVRIPLNYLVEI